MTELDYELGCRMPLGEWVALNRTGVFRDPTLMRYVSPFPPAELMHNVSGLVDREAFAAHGADFYLALSEASPKRLTEYRSILDFGCGCGRLARMFKGHQYRIEGCDIDRRHVEWINRHLDFMQATVTSTRPPLPYADGEFEAVISISIFTHLTERNQDEFLAELARIAAPNGRLYFTVHGDLAFARAVEEPSIRSMLDLSDDGLSAAGEAMSAGRHAFILQFGHLTTVPTARRSPVRKLRTWLNGLRTGVRGRFEYGIAFTSEGYVRRHWSQWFDVLDYRVGALHNFQDLVLLAPKPVISDAQSSR